MNEDATQLEGVERLEPVLLERRREWRMLRDPDPGLDLSARPVRLAELVEIVGKESTVLGYVERTVSEIRAFTTTFTFSGYLVGNAEPLGGPIARFASSAEDAFRRAQRDVEEALAA